MRADELRFADEPRTAVRFHGSPGRESTSRSERTNLPERVEAGTGYSDVRVDYRLATRLRDPGEAPDPEDPARDTPDPGTEGPADTDEGAPAPSSPPPDAAAAAPDPGEP
ncbi:hypothetical protein H181DRAFT_00581 [Streptomyces sp. WMMB 714]|uniref:hypothetical protein n=1 Tax=Streptomyces sp. WMMB 714 TaxID=1286822 RepID=UPI000823E28C|nr:hypothetical protein [Streptomyces sp. WMMB 714]SCK11132.1 hypothetical protein H181DRAFT_00581 [Streptomyces sp. WMMB 714]